MVGSRAFNRQLQENVSWHPLSLCGKDARALEVLRKDKGVLFGGDCPDAQFKFQQTTAI